MRSRTERLSGRARQMGTQARGQLRLWQGPDDPVHDAAIPEDDEGRDAARIEAGRERGILVDVDLDDLEPPGVLRGPSRPPRCPARPGSAGAARAPSGSSPR